MIECRKDNGTLQLGSHSGGSVFLLTYENGGNFCAKASLCQCR